MNNIDFYLSEMSVSDEHGGGITLQRVVDDDLEQIQLFAHVAGFAVHHPVVNRFSSRCLDMIPFFERNEIRSLMGSRPSKWVSQ